MSTVDNIIERIQQELSPKDAMVVYLTIASVLSTIERDNFIATMAEVILSSTEKSEDTEAAHNFISALCEAFEIADEKYHSLLKESINTNTTDMSDFWKDDVGES